MKIHFIGIGGIGVSALANYYLSHGAKVSGSDLSRSAITDDLVKKGAKVFIGRHRGKNLPAKTEFLIYSAAVTKDNHELKEAKSRRIKCQTYAQALGELTKKYFTIAVSGMHGKSTTASMVALILIEAGLDPTVIVGTKLKEFGSSNFRLGKSKYLVIEADEWYASFLNYWPKIIVLTNIEEEHLDYYRNLEHIKKTFSKYISHLSSDGILVANGEDSNVQDLISNFQFLISKQNLKSKFQVKNYNLKFKIKNLKLKIPGQHNLMNAYAAITVARALKIPDKISVKALNDFSGTWRRFEYKGQINGAKIFDDYGHHPTEIKATLQGAREYLNQKPKTKNQKQRLWCIFQPHQYQRTHNLFDQFVGAFQQADRVILLPIYSVAGREKAAIKKKVNSKILAEAIKFKNKMARRNQGVWYFNCFNKAAGYLRTNLKLGDVALIMGAGDIYKLTNLIIKK